MKIHGSGKAPYRPDGAAFATISELERSLCRGGRSKSTVARRAVLLLTAMGAMLLMYAGMALAQPSEKIFFTTNGGCTCVCVMNPDGTGSKLIADAPVDDVAPSPNGGKLAVATTLDLLDGFSWDSEIWLMNADGSGPTNLTNTPDAWESAPTWSPDGSKLAYERSYKGPDGAWLYEIWTMNADGSQQTKLTPIVGGRL